MSIALAIGIYFVIWWIVLFAVLPWGVRSQHENGAFEPGTDPGAPVAPLMLRKFVATTIIAGIIFASGYAAWQAGILSPDRWWVPFATR